MASVRFFNSLRFQITIAISLLVITAVVIMGLLLTYFARSYALQQKTRLGTASAQLIQRALANPTPAEEAAGTKGLRQLASRVSMQFYDGRTFHSITFFDNRYRILWSTLPNDQWPYSKVFSSNENTMADTLNADIVDDPVTEDSMLVLRFAWLSAGQPVGAVQLVIPVVSPTEEFLLSGRLILVFAVAYALIIILLGVMLLKQIILKPITELSIAVRSLRAGERDIRLPEDEQNELGMLARSFNQMARQLAENEQHQGEQIDELLVVNEELELTRRSLIRSEKLASIGRLAAGVAHEVGNPLSAILGYVELLRAGGLDDEMERDFLVRIEKDITRISTIIRGLLDYSRAQRERIERLDVNRVLHDTIDLLQPQKQFKRIAFDFTSHQNPAYVDADTHLLQQVLVNLFLNASSAMNEEGVITIFLERIRFDPSLTYRQAADKFKLDQSLIVVAIIDQGVGIPDDIQERIFDPFFTTKEPGQGTGLGLSVCDKIIDGFGGTIEVFSQIGEGSTFTLLLPESAPPAAPDPAGDDAATDGEPDEPSATER
jgi:signal transduction histidine kinase